MKRLGRGLVTCGCLLFVACGPANSGTTATTTSASSDSAESGGPSMIDCGPNACGATQVCVATETCCNQVDYACADISDACEGQSGDALAACMCSDTPVGHDPATGVVSCENFGCTTSCDNSDEGPIDDTGEPQVSCGDELCAPGDLCVQTATCCDVTYYECTPPGGCAGMTGIALAECLCFDTAAGYDDETSTVLCENFGCTTACPGDDESESETVETGNGSEAASDTSPDECTCFQQDECASPPQGGEPCVVDGECCTDFADFFLVCEAGVWVFDCTDG